MKCKIENILYLGVVLLYLFRPILPYFEYIIKRDYIIKNLCVERLSTENSCHGKCFLQEQLNKANELMNDDQKDKENKISDNRMTEDHLRTATAVLIIVIEKPPMSGYYIPWPVARFVPKIFVPPRKFSSVNKS